MNVYQDLPDELLRQAKARAALDGMRLRDLIEIGLRLALAMPSTPAVARRVTFPLHRSQQPGTLTAEAVRRAEEQAQLDEDTTHANSL